MTSKLKVRNDRYIPKAPLHDPQAVAKFVNNYLSFQSEVSAPLFNQIYCFKAFENPPIADRFMAFFNAIKKNTKYKGKVQLIMLDDSNDPILSKKLQDIAAHHNIQYEPTRNTYGTAFRLINRMRTKILNDSSHSDNEKLYYEWLCRAILTDKLKAPKYDSVVDATNAAFSPSIGGVHGVQNLGYLIAVYYAGKAGYRLKHTSVTINEDDQKYISYTSNKRRVDIESHDWLGERAAWFKDPKTFAITGRYSMHTGNPITMVCETLEICEKLIRLMDKKVNGNCILFDPESGKTSNISTRDAFLMLPDILQAAASRHPILGYRRKTGEIIGLFTKERHYKKTMDLDTVCKLDLGNVTLRGSIIREMNVPILGIPDYNLSTILKILAFRDLDVSYIDRAVRREEAITHHRVPRIHGGDVYGPSIREAFENEYAKEQIIVDKIINKNPDINSRIIETFDLNPNIKIKEFHRSFDINQVKLLKVRKLVLSIQQLLKAYELKGLDFYKINRLNIIKGFIRQFTKEKLDELRKRVTTLASDEEVLKATNNVTLYLDTYKIWRDFVDEVYKMGIEDSIKEITSKSSKVVVGILHGQLAHSGRPLEIASKLTHKGLSVDIEMGNSGRKIADFERIFASNKQINFESNDLYYFHPGEVIKGIQTTKDLAANIVKIAYILKEGNSHIVLSDHNVPLSIAARLMNIPTVSITNSSGFCFLSKDLIKDLGSLGESALNSFGLKLEPKLQKVYVDAYRSIYHKIPLYIPNWVELLEEGDLTLISDCPAFTLSEKGGFYKLKKFLPENAYLVGSIQPEELINSSVDKSVWNETMFTVNNQLKSGKKIIFGSFGSIKDPKIFNALIQLSLNNTDSFVVVTTSDVVLATEIPSNMLTIPFAILSDIVPLSDVLICQGGSGTIYPFIKYGRSPIITLPINADQIFNSLLVKNHKFGNYIYYEDLTDENLNKVITQSINGTNFDINALNSIKDLISLDGANTAANLIKSLF